MNFKLIILGIVLVAVILIIASFIALIVNNSKKRKGEEFNILAFEGVSYTILILLLLALGYLVINL